MTCGSPPTSTRSNAAPDRESEAVMTTRSASPTSSSIDEATGRATSCGST